MASAGPVDKVAADVDIGSMLRLRASVAMINFDSRAPLNQLVFASAALHNKVVGAFNLVPSERRLTSARQSGRKWATQGWRER